MTNPALGEGLGPILDAVAEVGEAFHRADRALFLVGGVVRDLAVGATSAGDDIDLTTDARPDEILDLVRPLAHELWTQGQRFGTIGLTVNHRRLEITTHRAEAYDPSSRKPIVSFGDHIDQDLSRRDFTINAMAIRVPDGELLDPFDGLGDLDRRRLRTPLGPAESFTDDPLRMLRAARFIPRFDLTADPDLIDAARDMTDRLSIVSVERIHDELERLLALSAPSTGLRFLADTGLLAQILPELIDPGAAVPIGAAPGTPAVRRAGLLRPLGPDGAAEVLARLRYSRADTSTTVGLIEAVAAAADPDPTDALIRRVVDRLGVDHLDDLTQLVTNVLGADTPFLRRLTALACAEDLSDLGSPLSGAQLIASLDLAPGPLVGKLMAHLQERRIDLGPMTAAEAEAAARAWLDRRPT